MNNALDHIFTLLAIIWNGITQHYILSFPFVVGVFGLVANIVKQSRGE